MMVNYKSAHMVCHSHNDTKMRQGDVMNNKIDFRGYSILSKTDFQGELSIVTAF